MQRRSFNRLMCCGLAALAVANGTSYIAPRLMAISDAVADPLFGFMHGIALGTLLLGLWQQNRRGNAKCA
jgi:hypothetical protein